MKYWFRRRPAEYRLRGNERNGAMPMLSRRTLLPMLTGFAGLFAAAALTAASPAHPPDNKDRAFRECSDCPEMIGIPAGKFVMGSPANEPGRFDSEGPLHVVSIKAFALGKYDITSQQFLVFLKETRYQPVAVQYGPRHGLAFAGEGDGLRAGI